jgi:catechol 2,3-dioxygenase-like lactoylglutathione lyase family enzyme
VALDRIDHFSIRTLKLEETRVFYENVMGMETGDRPPLPFPGYWLYLGEHAVIHLVGIDENNPEGLNEYLGEVNIDELSGGGAVDHLAFRASGSKDLIDRLKLLKIPYRERMVDGMNLFQLFVEDPNNITLELNYWDD